MKLFASTTVPALLGGCLYTGPIQLAPEVALSPSVAIDAVDPALTPLGTGPAPIPIDPALQTTVPFEILAIEDPNVNDTLTVRWFTDGFSTLWGEDVIPPAELEGDRSPIRAPGGIGVNLDLTVAFGNPPAPGLHRVEAIISDAGFLHPANDPVADNREPCRTEAPNCTVNANVHYLYWIVNITE